MIFGANLGGNITPIGSASTANLSFSKIALMSRNCDARWKNTCRGSIANCSRPLDAACGQALPTGFACVFAVDCTPP